MKTTSLIEYFLSCDDDYDGIVCLSDACKSAHDKFHLTYKVIHEIFSQELEQRKDIYLIRTSDIFVRGIERIRMPIIENQWVSHLGIMKNHNKIEEGGEK